MITALCGGVGGSKLVHGLYRALPANDLSVIVNTADDLEFCGLHVSPDLDTVTYTLAGLARADVGWGIEGDTFHALDMLQRFGAPGWFQVGDCDLATHVWRTQQLRDGVTITAVTAAIAQSLGVQAGLLPMCDERVSTRLRVSGEWIEFQEYFVHRLHRDRVDEIRYEGIEQARPSEAVLDAIAAAEVVIFVNSNPALSILPILSLPGMRETLARASAPRIAVSPFIGSAAVSGPAGALMALFDLPPTIVGLAQLYAGILDALVLDHEDVSCASTVQSLGIRTFITDIRMQQESDRRRLAEETLGYARSLR